MERTLVILKPDCVRKELIGEVTRRIQDAGFRIRALKMVSLSEKEAEGFYAVHEGKPFFESLIAFMTGGPCVPMVLEKENAVDDFRALIGATDPDEADEGTIRAEFADSIEQNIVHGSDSPENGRREVAYFFPEHEIAAHS
ncbi:MAG: nucleoside-diphosphate kinase [Bacteroidetes bacterium QS_8_64_10]|nr:MAG: nucleoside-diphosphate kinase [Bacteroidetes bacterium QS_8_64_10]